MRLAEIPVVVAPAAADCAGAEPFALQVLGDAMRPEFEPGDIIVVEPEGIAADGSFVVAFAAGEWMLRRLRRDGATWRLDVLNPAAAGGAPASIELPSLAAVRGVVIQKSRPGRRRSLKRYVE